MWIEVKDQQDIDKLMESYGFFQDSCLRDLYLSTREFVDDQRVMHFNNTLTASLLFQREFGSDAVLELKFEDIERLNFKPFEEKEHPVIYDATISKQNGLFYWADSANWEIDDTDSIWISGKKLFWRFRPELMGNIKRLKDERVETERVTEIERERETER